MEKQTKYEEAVNQLQDIVDRLENNQMGIDEMTTELKRAQSLLKLCRDRLAKTDKEVKKILLDDKN